MLSPPEGKHWAARPLEPPHYKLGRKWEHGFCHHLGIKLSDFLMKLHALSSYNNATSSSFHRLIVL